LTLFDALPRRLPTYTFGMSAFFTAVVIAFSPSNATVGVSDVRVVTRLSKCTLVQRPDG